MKKKFRYILTAFSIVILGIAILGYSILSKGFDTDKTVYIYVDSSKGYDALLDQVKDSARIQNLSSFKVLSSLLNYKDKMIDGRYEVTPNMSVYSLLKNLRSGHQTPVKLKFNNIRTKDDLSKRISDQLMFSKDDLFNKLEDKPIAESLGFDVDNIVAMFIPNTYEVYWDIDVDDFIQRMKKEYGRFWNEQRLSKAEELGLSPAQVSILASIVEEECTYSDEYPVVAGLYLNRLKINQPLQADPTVKFAVGDFSLKRILNKHLEVNSSYNTYRHTGLPPGPIRVPSIKGIDAVLNHDKNGYLYMCAKEDFSGRHNFANNYSAHQVNAAKYRKALDERGIK